jgi:hypothetical protein
MGRHQILARCAVGADFMHHQFCLWWGGTDPNHFILALGAWQPMLCVFAFILGIVAVLAGIGRGGSICSYSWGFFPFNLDFVRIKVW